MTTQTTTYGYRIVNGGETSEVSGCKSIEEAVDKCFGVAFPIGYVEPRWWQFWKRNFRKECDKVKEAARARQN
jgi:hypothetical protein